MGKGSGFKRDQFLLWMLAAIFATQAFIFLFAVTQCVRMPGGIRNCPDIGRRYDQTFGVMVATTLALLTGSQLTQPPVGGSSPRLQERAKKPEDDSEPDKRKALERPTRE